MNKRRTLVIAIAAYASLIVMLAQDASATTVFSQPFNNTSTGFFADGQGNQIADDFQLVSDAIITEVQWFGRHNRFTTEQQMLARPFKVSFYEDDGTGLPKTSSFFDIAVTVPSVLAGISSGNGEVFKYSVALPGISLVGGTTFWLQVMEDDPATTDNRWTWEFSFGFGSVAFRDVGSTGPWSLFPDPQLDPRNLAFNLNAASVPKPVPEPATLLLLGSGIVGMGTMARRRTRRK